MGDVRFASGAHVSKTSLTLGQGLSSKEPPVFTLPPRNTRISQGGTARLEGKVSKIYAILSAKNLELNLAFGCGDI